MDYVKVPVNVMDKIVSYMASKPYAEVAPILLEMQARSTVIHEEDANPKTTE